MDKTKIPWINCVITLPEQIEENFNKLLAIYKKKSRSKKKLKKKINRMTCDNLLNFNNENKNCIENANENILNEMTLMINKPEEFLFKIENKIIDYIDLIIKKYMNIYIHSDDKIYLISEKNKDNNKIFLKFYFPKIKTDNDDTVIENKINKFGDNIHFTLLPEIFGHGKDGLFHLTFRIEGKNKKAIYEYSKYISFNVVDAKIGVILYDDEKGNNAVIFKVNNSFDINTDSNAIMEFNSSFLSVEHIIDLQVYKDLCLYIALDIFKKLFETKKIDSFFARYLNYYGIDVFYKMIDKLLSIILSTFFDFYKNK